VLRKKHADGAVWLCDGRMKTIAKSGYFPVHDQLVIPVAENGHLSQSERRHISA
jgi:hypothetical protein